MLGVAEEQAVAEASPARVVIGVDLGDDWVRHVVGMRARDGGEDSGLSIMGGVPARVFPSQFSKFPSVTFS